MKMYDTTQAVEKYLNVELECDCGRTHYAPIKAVAIGKGALETLPKYVVEFGYKHPYLICDKITYQVAGQRCEQLLKEAGYEPFVLILKHLGFDEATLGEIVLNKPNDCDLMVGVGTGSITDMIRFASFKLGLPCFTVCTAAPMDGFSASAGIMNVDNLKKTMPAHSSEVIIGDTDVLVGAPYRMTVAGYGDLIAKLNALNDWRLDVLVNDGHYCKNMDVLVDDYVKDIMTKHKKLKNREPEAVGDVMNALLLTGLTISLYGTSRPISGGEHHMSHYWEALGDQQGKAFAMHGEQAAVGTVLTLMVAEELRDKTIDFDRARAAAKAYDADKWQQEIRRAYGSAADAIIELEETSQKNGVEGRLRRIDRIEQRWAEVKAILDEAYSSRALLEQLRSLGCPATPKDIGVDEALLRDTFYYSKETRAVYTIMGLLWDLGLMQEITDAVIGKLQSMGEI